MGDYKASVIDMVRNKPFAGSQVLVSLISEMHVKTLPQEYNFDPEQPGLEPGPS